MKYIDKPNMNKNYLNDKYQSVYIFKNPLTGQFKIGISIDVEKRLRVITMVSGIEMIKIYNSSKFSNANKAEKAIHRRLSKYRKIGEWFDLDEDMLMNVVKEVLNLPRFKKEINNNTKLKIELEEPKFERLKSTNWFKILN